MTTVSDDIPVTESNALHHLSHTEIRVTGHSPLRFWKEQIQGYPSANDECNFALPTFRVKVWIPRFWSTNLLTSEIKSLKLALPWGLGQTKAYTKPTYTSLAELRSEMVSDLIEQLDYSPDATYFLRHWMTAFHVVRYTSKESSKAWLKWW